MSTKKSKAGRYVAIFFIVLYSVMGVWLHTMVYADDIDWHDSFAIVRHHEAGEPASEDAFYPHSYGLWFKVFGPSEKSRIWEYRSDTAEGAKAKLMAAITDEDQEFTIIEIVERP